MYDKKHRNSGLWADLDLHGKWPLKHCICECCNLAHTHTHPFNSPFSRTTQVSRYQKGKTNLDFTEATNSEWQWHQLDHAPERQPHQHPTALFFTGQMPLLPPNQQRQSTVLSLFITVATTSAACAVMLQISAGCCLRTQRSTNVRPVQQQAHWNQACRPQRLCQLCPVCECILIVVFRFHNLRGFVDEGYNDIYSMVTRPTLC